MIEIDVAEMDVAEMDMAEMDMAERQRELEQQRGERKIRSPSLPQPTHRDAVPARIGNRMVTASRTEP